MKKIEKVTVSTGKKCTCKGSIVEIFTTKHGKGNGVIGPGYSCPSWVESLGFGCATCGLQYGEPIFKKTEATEQVRFELNLYEATTTCRITIEDLPPLIRMIKGPKYKTLVANQTVTFQNPKEKVSKPKIPSELKNLKVGTKVFVLPSDNHHLNLVNEYKHIQLTKEKGAKVFEVKKSFIV